MIARSVIERRQSASVRKRLAFAIPPCVSSCSTSLVNTSATSVIRYARGKAPGTAKCLNKLLDRKSARLASIALANKMARIAWSVLTRGEIYRNTYPVPKPT